MPGLFVCWFPFPTFAVPCNAKMHIHPFTKFPLSPIPSIQLRFWHFPLFTHFSLGNLGLWDLVGALRWIRAEVPTAWAGDRRRITLMGHGAGAAAVSALSCSPYARDLFSQAIQMSGSILAQNAVGAFVVNETMALARAVNCPIGECVPMANCNRQANKPCIQTIRWS